MATNSINPAQEAPRRAKKPMFIRVYTVLTVIPTRSRKPPLKQFCIGDLAGVIVVIRNIHKIWTLQTSVVILLSRKSTYLVYPITDIGADSLYISPS